MAGRPLKKGLNYRSGSTHKYEDFRIVDLLDKYGPSGALIYDIISDMVLQQGYYLEIPLQNLALSVQKTVGSKWIRNKGFVLQVVQYCADIGLFDKDLLRQSVITSVELQESYKIGTVRSKVQIKEYRLIEEDHKSLLNAPQKSINVTEMPINATEIRDYGTENQRSVGLSNNIYDIEFLPEVEKEFQLYLLIRKSNYGEIPLEQINALREELQSLSADQEEQIAIIKKASAGGWKSFYKLKKEKKSSERPKTGTRFNNFQSREYDMKDLEKQLLGTQVDGNE